LNDVDTGEGAQLCGEGGQLLSRHVFLSGTDHEDMRQRVRRQRINCIAQSRAQAKVFQARVGIDYFYFINVSPLADSGCQLFSCG
jgi:hypothetical protein